MPTPATSAPEQTVRASQDFLAALLGDHADWPFTVRFWDGTVWGPSSSQPGEFTLVLKHPGALRAMFWPADELTMGEAYIHDDFDVEGSLEAIFPLVAALQADQRQGVASKLQQAKRLFSLPAARRSRDDDHGAHVQGRVHSVERDRQAVQYHYDQSNAFFSQFLDRRMVYSCAYFSTPEDDIDTAQTRKLDYICRKLRLRPGERLLDIGCGWGGLAIHAAANYGVDVTGVTLSVQQAAFAAERIREEGLGDHCRVLCLDYREVDAKEGYDKVASIGMFEHVGEAQLPAYFRRAWELLRPGGVFLNHGICKAANQRQASGRSFVARYVWPDGELETVGTTLRTAEQAGFELRDVESLREHYALTLRQWVRRLEANHAAAQAAKDEVTYRIWRLYMAGSAFNFAAGNLSIFQSLFAKPAHGVSGLPLSRADWYAPSPAAAR